MTSDRPEEEPMTAVAEARHPHWEFQAHTPLGPLTADDLPYIDLGGVPFEIEDGALILMPPPSPWHADTAFTLHAYLKPSYPYVTAEVSVAIGDNVRLPDVMALSLAREDVLKGEAMTLPARIVMLAVEIVSHDRHPARDRISVRRDRVVKFAEYAQAGIPEYWIVDEVADDPLDASVEIYRLKDAVYGLVRTVLLSELLAEGAAEKTA